MICQRTSSAQPAQERVCRFRRADPDAHVDGLDAIGARDDGVEQAAHPGEGHRTVRFDVVSVLRGARGLTVEHLRGAF